MTVSRRTFLGSAAATAVSLAPAARLLADAPIEPDAPTRHRGALIPDRFDPWVEVIPANLAHNATCAPTAWWPSDPRRRQESRVRTRLPHRRAAARAEAGDRGLRASFAPTRRLPLREQGIRKPILLMARVDDSMMAELAARAHHARRVRR